jgi:hypothetical protein
MVSKKSPISTNIDAASSLLGTGIKDVASARSGGE